MTGWQDEEDPTNPWTGESSADEGDDEVGADLDGLEEEPDPTGIAMPVDADGDVADGDVADGDEVEESPSTSAEDIEDVQLDPAVAVAQVEPVTFGPVTVPPSDAERDLLPGVTDVAADIGYARGVGTDDLGLVEIEVNGLMGVTVSLAPGLVTVGAEQAGHHLAGALEEARDEVVGYLEEHFRSHPTTAEWLEMRPESDESGLAGGQRAASPGGRSRTSEDGLVTVLLTPGGAVASVVINSDEVDLARIAPAFVAAAEQVLQGGDDETPGIDVDRRMAAFDAALAKLDKSMDDLGARLDQALGS